MPVQQKSSRGRTTGRLRELKREDYGLGLEVVVVVVLVELDEFGGVDVVVVLVFVVSLVFSVVAGGFTTVVLCSVFFSGAGEVAGATTSVFCSQAPRSAALAKMQINFFIVWIGCPFWDNGDSNRGKFSALPKGDFQRQLRLAKTAAQT
jgi:hypothetical protein